LIYRGCLTLLLKGMFKRDVRGGFELNPKEIPLSPLILLAMDRREHEKERASLQR